MASRHTSSFLPPSVCAFIIRITAKGSPFLVVGIGTGLHHKTSIQIPSLVNAAVKTHKSQYVGKGLAVGRLSTLRYGIPLTISYSRSGPMSALETLLSCLPAL